MTRTEILKALASLPFALIWPGNWDDVGFTERPIWVNSKGYGYIMCDEPCTSLEIDGAPLEKWRIIHKKLDNRTLRYEDIEGTSLVDLVDEITYGYFNEDEDDVCEALSNLTKLTTEQIDTIYGLETFEGWQFFATEEAFNAAYERDWADMSWDEMDDDLLLEWIDRLSIEADPKLNDWANRYGFSEDIEDENDEAPVIVESGKYSNWWTANNTKEFQLCCSTFVFEGKKKRYVTLIATGVRESDDPKTVFRIVSTRKKKLGEYVVAGTPNSSESIATDEELGKWSIVKSHMYLQLINMVTKIAGKDPFVRSLELFLGIKEALNTSVLDHLIEEYENMP